jgi:hypothetical protein
VKTLTRQVFAWTCRGINFLSTLCGVSLSSYLPKRRELSMNDIVIKLGEMVCRAGSGLAGVGQARCYDSYSMQYLGYALVTSLMIVVLWSRAWSRTG